MRNVTMISLMFLAACSGAPPTTEVSDSSAIGTALKPRPVAAVLTNVPGPTAGDDSSQWQNDTVTVGQAIPDNNTSGVSRDIKRLDVGSGSCASLYGLKFGLDVTHPHAADLVVTVSSVSRDGTTVLASLVAWNGPKAAQGKSQKQIDALSLPGTVDVTKLITATSDCARWRVNIADVVASQTGTFNNMTLERRTAVYPWVHDAGYFQRLLSGGDVSLDVADFYRTESRGNFTFTNGGVVGPVDYPNWLNRTDPQHHQDAVWLMEAAGFDFSKYDSDGDGFIRDDELELVAFWNAGTTGGANRPAASGCDTLKNSSLRVCSHMVFIGSQPDFETLCHELSHSLGTVDLYGTWGQECLSYGLTLMSCTISFPDDPHTLFHDPWHRSKLGWMSFANPGWASSGGSVALHDDSWRDSWGAYGQPAILRNYSPTGGAAAEYFIFEQRDPGPYDVNLTNPGVVVWHVQEDKYGNAWAGSDGKQPEGHAIYAVSSNGAVGGSRAWTHDDGRFQLAWADGTVLPYTFWVDTPPGNTNTLYWASAPANNQPPTVTITSPADGSSGGYGFGNPVSFTATVVDSRGKTLPNARVDWVSDVDGWIGSGTSMSYAFGTPGKRTITATGYDNYGAHASTTVHYEATLVGPTATIFKPTAGQKIYKNQLVELSGNGSTPTIFSLGCDNLTWTLDLQPGWSQTGCDIFVQFDILGKGTFTLTVVDPYGQTGSAQVHVIFAKPTAPVVTITSPTDLRFMNSATIPVAGVVTDPAGTQVNYAWSAYVQATGQEILLSTAQSFDWVPASSGIYNGYVDLRLYGANALGQTTMASTTLYIDYPPQ